MCLVCGHVGCGRDKSCHAQRHWQATSHTYARPCGNSLHGQLSVDSVVVWIVCQPTAMPLKWQHSECGTTQARATCIDWFKTSAMGSPSSSPILPLAVAMVTAQVVAGHLPKRWYSGRRCLL